MFETFPVVREEDDQDRLDGIEAHRVARMMIADKPHGCTNPHIVRHCEAYVQDIIDNRPNPCSWFEAESEVIDVTTARKAYVDAWAAANEHLVIWELKYGYRPVPVEGNPQMALYAKALKGPSTETIEFRIFQPRCYDGHEAVRTWQTTPEELYELWDELGAAANDARTDQPLAVSGPIQCGKCPGIHACAVSQRTAYEQLGRPLQLLDPDGNALAAEYARITEALEYLKIRASGIEEHVLATGLYLPGYTIGTGRGSRKLNSDISWLAEMYNVKPTKEVDLTPKQLEDAGIPTKVLSPFVTTTAGKKKLKAVDPTAAKEMFDGTD